MRCKYNIKIIKWLLTLLILLFNMGLIGGNREFQIKFGIFINFSAVLIFVLFTLFPRRYYFISEKGISYQKANGKEKWFLSWRKIRKMDYCSVGIIPVAVEVWYEGLTGEECKALHISYKQYSEIIEKFNQNITSL